MGSCGSSVAQNTVHPSGHLDVTSFVPDRVIGEGGFGRVLAVRMIREGPTKGNFYAMKQLSKEDVLMRNHVGMVMNERQLLEKLRHPLLVNLHFAFQTSQNLYLVLDMCTGGDVHRELTRNPRRRFSEHRVRFYAASLVCVLGYMHSRGVIHRDIKPENLLLDADGRLRVTDLGISQMVGSDGSSHVTSGTRPYMAPEVFLTGHEHSFASDYYSLGITLFQMLTGHRPYRPDKHVLRQLVRQALYVPPQSVTSLSRARRILISAQDRKCTVPELKFGRKLKHVSEECRDFVLKCLICSPAYRLGARGVAEVLDHPWFAGMDIDAIAAGVAQPPARASVNVLDGVPEGPPPSIEGHRERQTQFDTELVAFRGWSFNTDPEVPCETIDSIGRPVGEPTPTIVVAMPSDGIGTGSESEVGEMGIDRTAPRRRSPVSRGHYKPGANGTPTTKRPGHKDDDDDDEEEEEDDSIDEVDNSNSPQRKDHTVVIPRGSIGAVSQSSPVTPLPNTPAPHHGTSTAASLMSSDQRTTRRAGRASVHHSASTIGEKTDGSTNFQFAPFVVSRHSSVTPGNGAGGSRYWSQRSSEVEDAEMGAAAPGSSSSRDENQGQSHRQRQSS